MDYLREQWNTFLTAITFLTRIPCPTFQDGDETRLSRSLLYFPLAGALVGGVGAGVFFVMCRLYSQFVAAVFAIAAMVVITGAFHEDAFADVCDAFGGMTPERRLEIMKDSRVGSFGVAGLVLMILAKVAVLSSMNPASAVLALIAAPVMSRWSSFYMISRFPRNARKNSLTGPLGSHATFGRLMISGLIAFSLCLPLGVIPALLLLIATILLCQAAGYFFLKWINGISGDCLGAVIQVTELVCYLVIVKPLFR